jgi:predicted GH43/DUF377 family glycosyl hydrolase
MDFSKRIGKLKKEAVFELDGYYVWCGTMTRDDDGLYYFYFSFWEKSLGFNAWVTHSKVGFAVGKDPFGKMEYGGIALDGRGHGYWDGDCIHNPSVIRVDGKYYMYYMGNYGNGEYWVHRNHQRIGVAVATDPRGPWERFDTPVIDISPTGHDSLMTSNPSVTVTGEGKFVMIYKAVENNGKLPQGGAVVCGIAIADSPIGPFVKLDKPIMVNPENEWSVEDAFIWFENGQFYSLAKDFHGYFTGAGQRHVALFESVNGYDWKLSDTPIGYLRGVTFEDGERLDLHYMERPQIYVEDGKPFALLCACMLESDYKELSRSFNIRLPLDEK